MGDRRTRRYEAGEDPSSVIATPSTAQGFDISAVPLLRQATFLPVFVYASHAAGRRDIVAPLARAALAAGANGLMVEVHPHPAVARCDSQQQLDLEEFAAFLEQLATPVV